jgi:hypothetical protein
MREHLPLSYCHQRDSGSVVTPTFWDSLRSSTHITRLVLIIFRTAIPPALAFTGYHCFKILFPTIEPYASGLVVLQSSAHLLMSLKSVLPPPIRLLASVSSNVSQRSFQFHLTTRRACRVTLTILSTQTSGRVFVIQQYAMAFNAYPASCTLFSSTTQLSSVTSRAVPLRANTVLTMS